MFLLVHDLAHRDLLTNVSKVTELLTNFSDIFLPSVLSPPPGLQVLIIILCEGFRWDDEWQLSAVSDLSDNISTSQELSSSPGGVEMEEREQQPGRNQHQQDQLQLIFLHNCLCTNYNNTNVILYFKLMLICRIFRCFE